MKGAPKAAAIAALIGQFDSPYVRRVGLALHHYGIPFVHRPLSVFSNAAEVEVYNPLIRVPVLLLANGQALAETSCILAFLDQQQAEERRLSLVSQGSARMFADLQLQSLATGLCDKAVALFYMQKFAQQIDPAFGSRVVRQLEGGVTALDELIATIDADQLSHGVIAAVCATRFLAETHPRVGREAARLRSFCERWEMTPMFAAVSQPFIAPP